MRSKRISHWLPVIALAMTGAVASPATPAAAAPAVSCSDVAATEVAATQLAKSCSRDVAVESSRSEYAQVVAHADGRLTFESAVVPQRARQADGRWANIDLSLRPGKGGLLRPGVSIADVAFSPGGTGPLATVKRDGKTFTMSWPGKLPAPTVAGDSATYANVLSGVDLVVRATRTGFTHVLVVKTPAAGALVHTVKFNLGGDAQVTRAADGSLRAMAGKTVIAQARPAVMWDSTAPMARTAGLAASSARSAGDTAQVRPIKTEIAGRSLVLRPDVSLLSASSAYPVYVDPDWEYGSGTGQKWAYATSNNANNTDYGTARVGKRPDGDYAVYRSFFEFPLLGNTPTGQMWLHGKHIRSAYVQMHLWHSSKCSDAWTHMYLTPAINATMKASYSAMTLSSYQASAAGHANKAGGCGANQPDMLMNFHGNMTNLVQQASNENWQHMTLGFAGRDANGNGEGSSDSWMKYLPDNSKLVVEYDSRPDTPNGMQIASIACTSGVISVGTLTPNMSAVYPDADTSQTLTGAYEWIEVPGGGIGTVNDSYPSRLSPGLSANATANGRAWTSALPTLTKNKIYAYRLRTTDPDPYFQVSPWSPWCQFEVDTTVPQVSVSAVAIPAGPGEPGSFQITSTSGDVTKFKYGWGAATTEVSVPGTPKSATVMVTAPKFGQNILHVSAVDATGNEGFGSIEFAVGRPTPAVARWGLETYPGTDQTAALADKQPTLAGNTPLIPANHTWADDARLVGGKSLSLQNNASAATAVPVIDTARSFSVAVWVKPGQCGPGIPAVASADGDRVSAFMLDRDCTAGKWRAVVHPQDTDNIANAYLFSSAPVGIGRWQHLALVYDSVEKQIRLYVDGALQGTAQVPAGIFAANGGFVIGRSKWNGAVGSYFNGQLADMQVFDRALVPQDFTGVLATEPRAGGFNEPGFLAPIRVGQWDFNAAVPCYTADLRDTCESPDLTGWDRWLALSRGSAVGAGRSTSDGGLWLDDGYFLDEGNTETGTLESGRSASKTGLTLPDENGLEFTTWQDKSVLRTDQSFTVSTWVNLTEMPTGTHTVLAQDGNDVSGFYLGTRIDQATGQHKWTFTMHDADNAAGDARNARAIDPITTADVGRWTELTAVYDAPRGELRLYVNGVKQVSDTRPANVVPWHAGGALTVGRASFQGSQGDYFTGAIDDVQAFQGALTDVDVTIVHSGITVEPPQVIGDSAVEDSLYPNSAAILAARGMRLISGDGHLTLSECVSPGGEVRLYFRPDYARYPTATGGLCFKVTGGTAHLTMDIPGTYSIRGGNTPAEAKLITDGQPQTVQIPVNTWTPVGEGVGTGHYSVLKELHIGQGMASVTGANAAVGKLDTGGRACTGTLIHKQWVLTAASCFADRASLAQGAPPRTTQIVFPGHAPVAVNHLVPRPDRDLVLGRLATAITDITPIGVAAAAPAADASLNTVGFGRTATEWVTDQQRSATVTLSEVTATVLTGSTTAGRLCKGDAGGAVTNTAGEIVGVNSESGQSGCLGSSATGTRTSHARADNIVQWIDGQRSFAGPGPGENWSVLSGATTSRHVAGAGTDPREGSMYTSVRAAQAGGSIYQDMGWAVNPGDTICANAHVVTEGAATGGGGTLALWLVWGTVEGSNKSVVNLPNGNGWTPVSTCVTATSGHSGVRVEFYPAVGGPSIGIDAVDVHQSIAINGGFNNGSGNWSVGANSNYDTYGPGVTGNDPYEGTRFAATNTAVTSDGIYQDVNLAISPGDTFCGSAQVATAGNTGGASGSFVIWLVGATQTNSVKPFANLPGGNNWTPVSTCITATTAYNRLRVQFYPHPNAPSTIIDAVDVHKSVAVNGGFNNGFSNWSVGANSYYAIYGPGVTGNDPYEGTGFVATSTAVTSDGIYQDVNLAINPGDTFCGSAQVAAQGTTGGASGEFVIWLIGASQTKSSKLLSNLPGGNNWKRVETCVTATAGYDRLRVQFYPHPSTGSVIIDAVDVHKSNAVNGGFNIL